MRTEAGKEEQKRYAGFLAEFGVRVESPERRRKVIRTLSARRGREGEGKGSGKERKRGRRMESTNTQKIELHVMI